MYPRTHNIYSRKISRNITSPLRDIFLEGFMLNRIIGIVPEKRVYSHKITILQLGMLILNLTLVLLINNVNLSQIFFMDNHIPMYRYGFNGRVKKSIQMQTLTSVLNL